MENDQFLDKLVLNLVPKSLWPAGLLEAERLKEEQKITAIAQCELSVLTLLKCVSTFNC